MPGLTEEQVNSIGTDLMRQASVLTKEDIEVIDRESQEDFETRRKNVYKEFIGHSHDGIVVGSYDVSPHVYAHVANSWIRMQCPICFKRWLVVSTGVAGVGYAEEETVNTPLSFAEVEERKNKFINHMKARQRIMAEGSV